MDNEILRLAIYGLAVFRLAQLVTLDDGPFDIFKRLREFTDGKHVKEQEIRQHGLWATIDGILQCQYCSGMYLALAATILFTFQQNFWVDLVVLWMAIAGLQAYLEGRK